MRELLKRGKCGSALLEGCHGINQQCNHLRNKRMQLLGQASLTTVREETRMPGPAMTRTSPEMKQADPDVRCCFTTLKPVET